MTRCFWSSWLHVGCAVLVGTLFDSHSVQAQDVPPRKYAVQLSATVDRSQIRLQWPNEGDALSYEVSRRTGEAPWKLIATLGGSETSFTDANVSPGAPYEYQFIKNTGDRYTGYGYIGAGIRVPLPDHWGTVILVVENSLAGALKPELTRLENDLRGDGWRVIRRNVSAFDSPPSVKAVIQQVYQSDPRNVKAAFLLGHVPVPYSGDFFPDGHDNHRGAWPADVYYGDMDGTWTDSTVRSITAEREVNWNVPGDGKFDQTYVPSPVELMIGRVDLSNLTCFANKSNSRSEVDLTRAYLSKNHAFRTGNLVAEPRGLICDNFSDKGRDPISNTAWRSFAGFFGPNRVMEVGWNGYLPEVTQRSYLWSYASGGGSYYYSMGVASADDFALQDLRVVFAMFMGSYFGDWNNESNFLRASLGSGSVLTVTYSGFPHTILFPMALGETIGHAIRLTQNSGTNSIYPPRNKGAGQVHVALLGDPTLRMHAVKAPSGLSAIGTGSGIQLNWTASPEATAGYHLYRASTPEGPFMRLTAEPLNDRSFTDLPKTGRYTYMVRAVKLEQTGSGTYLNLSPGVFSGEIEASAPGPVRPLNLEAKLSRTGPTLQVTGDPGQRFTIQSSLDFKTWSDLTNGTLPGTSLEVAVPAEPSAKQRFFRTVTEN